MTYSRIHSQFFALALLLALLTACAATPAPPAPVRLTLAGADSMQWLARALANQYTLLHPHVSFSIQPSNSAAGLSAGVEYTRTVGLVSRVLRPAELFGARAIVVARDGVAVVVNQKNPINAIQRSQITQVFSGDILTWPTGPDAGKRIVVVSREEGSGTRSAFEAMIMNGQRVTLTAVVMPGEAAVVDYIANHTDAIGYVSMGALTPNIHALAVDGVPLSLPAVESQKYPLVRTLALVVPLQPDPELQAFVDFAIGPEGQTVIGQRYGRAP